jgi:predicted CoA-binding protein
MSKTLILGASLTPSQYSNIAINRLVDNTIKVVAIGKKEGIVKGVKIVTTPEKFEDIDTVNLYLNANNQKIYYDYIVGLKPRRVIFNPGAENEELERILTSNNIAFERSCSLVLLSLGKY